MELHHDGAMQPARCIIGAFQQEMQARCKRSSSTRVRPGNTRVPRGASWGSPEAGLGWAEGAAEEGTPLAEVPLVGVGMPLAGVDNRPEEGASLAAVAVAAKSRAGEEKQMMEKEKLPAESNC